MTYTCIDENNPSRLRGLRKPQDVISNIIVDCAHAYTVPMQAGWTKPATVHPMYFDVNGRTKRAFIFMPYSYGTSLQNPRKVIVGWPGSDGNPSSDGAKTLFDPYNGYGNVNTWFANLVMAKDCMGLAIDDGKFGYNPYQTDASNLAPDPQSAMLDDLCAILALKYAILNYQSEFSTRTTEVPTDYYLGGYSYGAIRAEFCSSMIGEVLEGGENIRGVYVASGQLDKRIDARAECCPGEWAYTTIDPTGYNYDKMAQNNPSPKIRFSFGGNADYLYVTSPQLTPSINTILTNLVASNPAKFSRYDHNGGHVPVYSDIKAFFDSVF